jgi:membrane protein YdbS with pleckstrin-like domain
VTGWSDRPESGPPGVPALAVRAEGERYGLLMPYPKKNLNTNETIALDMHPHWWYFAEPAMALLVSIVLGVVVLTQTDAGTTGRKVAGLAIVALLVITAFWLIGRYLKWLTTNFVITSQRLIFRQGVIAKSGIEIPLERVNNVNFSQSIFERVLGAGDLLIESGGEDGQQRFTDIRRPDKVQNLVHAQVEALIQQRAGYMRPVSGGGIDVAEQLERLEGLLQRGTITQEEFDSQKAKLLG